MKSSMLRFFCLRRFYGFASCVALAGALSGCGGGGGGSTSEPRVITGVAATGAAFEGGTIRVFDSSGVEVGATSAIGSDGSFRIELAAGATAPLIVVASRPTVDGQTQALTSLVASNAQTVANVTPVTTLVAALLSPSGDPSRLALELSARQVQINDQTVSVAVQRVQSVVQPLLEATGAAGTDPLTGSFLANGRGYDRFLDSLQVSIVPASSGSNIEVAVRQRVDDPDAQGTTPQPVSISFVSTASSPPSLPTIDPSRLVAEGTSEKIAAFLNQLTACYAIPFEQRVRGVSGPEMSAVVGGPSDILASTCRDLFADGDPGNFLNNGLTVGRDSNNVGAFTSLFRRSFTGTIFSSGSYEFTRANGDIVIGYRARDTLGNVAFDSLVVRQSSGDGRLRLIGNQYRYSGSVVPYHQLRQFITLDQSPYTYRSVGYVLNVDNQLDANRNPLFDRVEVTSPVGARFMLKPSAGLSYLALVRDGVTLPTSFVRLRSDFVTQPANPPSIPSMDTVLYFANSALFPDTVIVRIPATAAWTFRYFLAGNTSNNHDAIQVYKTRARALSIDELTRVELSSLSSGTITDIQLRARPADGVVPLPTNGPEDLGAPASGRGWTVTDRALPATQMRIYGSFSGRFFNDFARFGSTARTTQVACESASRTDTHCTGSSAAGGFAPGSVATGYELWSRDATGREYANHYAAYRLTLPATAPQ